MKSIHDSQKGLKSTPPQPGYKTGTVYNDVYLGSPNDAIKDHQQHNQYHPDSTHVSHNPAVQTNYKPVQGTLELRDEQGNRAIVTNNGGNNNLAQYFNKPDKFSGATARLSAK